MSQANLPVENRRKTWKPPHAVLHILCLSIMLSFLGSVALAASVFPSEYDIRYRWLSSLASARDNPQGHHYLGFGLICISLLSAPIARYLFLHCPGHDLVRRGGVLSYAGGIIGMLGLGVEAAFFPNTGPVRVIHQVLTLVAFGGYAAGLSCFVLLVAVSGCGMRTSRRYAWTAGTLIAAPLIASSLTNFVWYLTAGNPELFGSDHPKRLPWVILSQPLWEWSMVIDLMIVLYLTVWYVARVPAPKTPSH